MNFINFIIKFIINYLFLKIKIILLILYVLLHAYFVYVQIQINQLFVLNKNIIK